jgi:hypothetical protein
MNLDPQLLELRRSLGRFRRRVWLRRIVRDGTFILAGVVVAELVLAVIARLIPFQWHGLSSVVAIAVGAVALLIDAIRVRPTLAEAALAVDSEETWQIVSTALSLAITSPDRIRFTCRRRGHRFGAGHLRPPGPPATARRALIPHVRRPARPASCCRGAEHDALLCVPLIPLLLPNGQNDVLALRERRCGETRRSAWRRRPTGSTRVAPRPIRASTSPRSCASWHSICATTRRICRPTSPGWARSRTRSARVSIPPMSSGPRRSRAVSRSRAAPTGGDSGPQGDPQKTQQTWPTSKSLAR